MASTLLLDLDAWDLVLDVDGNIAIAAEPYALAQDAASAIKTYLGEPYWDTTVGVPWLQQVFGKNPSLQVVKALINAAAASVPGVTSAQCFISSAGERTIAGQVQVRSEETGQVAATNFAVVSPQGG